MSIVHELEYYANLSAGSSPCRDLSALLLKAAKEIRRLEQQVQDLRTASVTQMAKEADQLQKPARTTPPQPDTLSPLSQTPHWQDPELYERWLAELAKIDGGEADQGLRGRIQALVGNVDVDLDAPLSPDDE